MSNNYSAPVANGHKVAAGGRVASSTLACKREQLDKAENAADVWYQKYGALFNKRNEESEGPAAHGELACMHKSEKLLTLRHSLQQMACLLKR